MKKFLLSCAALAFSMSVFAEETVIFFDDYEWLEPATSTYTNKEGKSINDNIGQNVFSGAYNPQMGTGIFPGGGNTADLMADKGYTLLGSTYAKNEVGNSSKVAPTTVNGVGKNYLKISITTFCGGIVLPSLEKAGDGVENAHISFKWTPMASGAKVYDKTEAVVIVENGTDKKVYTFTKDIPDESDYKWYEEDIDLTGIKIDKNTKITFRNSDNQFPDYGTVAEKKVARWFLDDVKVYTSTGAAVNEIVTDENVPVEYFNLQGVKVANPENGIFIRHQGSKTSKVVM